MDRNTYQLQLEYSPACDASPIIIIGKNNRQVNFRELPERERRIYESMAASMFSALSDENEELNPKKDKEK